MEPLAVKVDPGSRTTGVALVRVDAGGVTRVLQGFELEHRGKRIGEALTQRAQRRRKRRGNLRFRPKRFDNRRKTEGWLPPSLRYRVDTTKTMVDRLRRLAPVASIEMKLVRFDTQLMQDPTVSGDHDGRSIERFREPPLDVRARRLEAREGAERGKGASGPVHQGDAGQVVTAAVSRHRRSLPILSVQAKVAPERGDDEAHALEA